MRYITRLLLSLVLLTHSIVSPAQTDSCHLRISLLTCSPGAELYSSFGHTALRVTDLRNGADIVFNYGVFDDSDPTKFYMDFTRGLMLYALASYSFREFENEYRYQSRSVVEQELQLSCAEKTKLYAALQV